MDFFARQDQARKKTKLLVFYFVVAVILIIALNYVVGLVVLTSAQSSQHRSDRYEPAPPLVLWNPQIFLGASVITLAIVFIGSAFKILPRRPQRRRGARRAACGAAGLKSAATR